MIITLADAKAHLNLTTDDDDNHIVQFIWAAEDWIRKYLGEDDLESLTDTAPDAEPYLFPIQIAALMLVAHFYDNREATLVGVTAQETPLGLYDMLAPYRCWVF